MWKGVGGLGCRAGLRIIWGICRDMICRDITASDGGSNGIENDEMDTWILQGAYRVQGCAK